MRASAVAFAGKPLRSAETARRMSVEEFAELFVGDKINEDEARQFGQRLAPEDKKEMKAMGIARLAADDVETLSDMTHILGVSPAARKVVHDLSANR